MKGVSSASRKDMLISIENAEPLESERSERDLLAGAASINIRPPPGMPMAGFSIFSSSGTGVRNMIMARVIYLKPKRGNPVALVQADLLSGSRIVHHKVAELISGKTDIDAGGLLICGTHTHSAPGNYFGNKFYNDHASNASGFNVNYFNFLCFRISEAVVNAYQNKRPAKVATGTTSIWKVTKNRSLPAYLNNRNIRNIPEQPDQYEAVNPYLHLIRVDCLVRPGHYKPIAAFSNFSLHPNTNPSELGKFYHGDITAYVERELESGIRRHYKTPWQPVHAAANYTHGDCNPAYDEKIQETFADQKRLGRIIAGKALELFISLDDQLKDDIVVSYRAKEIDFFKDNSIDGIKIAGRPRIGMASAGGALGRGRRTFLSYIPLFAPGWPRLFFTGGEQGHKRILLGPLQGLFIPKKDFPHILFIQVIRIDDTILLPLPWEVTFEMGNRICAYAEKKGNSAGIKKVSRYNVVSCSNGYWGYVNTPEEYSMQYYEGASNYYGPYTGNFLKAHFGKMVENLALSGTDTDLPGKWDFNVRVRDFYPEKLEPVGQREIKEKPVYNKAKNREEPFWSFSWYDVPPRLIDFHSSLVSIEVSSDNRSWEPLVIKGEPVDDSGCDISIHFLDKISDKKMGLYEARWHNPVHQGRKFCRFAVQPRNAEGVFYSPPFTGKQ